jgi:cobalt-zinc-cadmium efflux system outer membrane protein
VTHEVDATVCDLAAQPLDIHTPTAREPEAAAAKPGSASAVGVRQAGAAEEVWQQSSSASNQTPGRTPPEPLVKRVQLPPGLPQRREEIPPLRDNATPAERQAYRAQYFPKLEPLPPLPKPQPGPFGHPLTLPELQQLALSNSPALRQAAADVQAAEGAARQAGAYPNPSAGYQSDNAGSGSTAGFQGFFVEQVIKTAGKLKAAQASALMSVLNARLALRRAQTDIMTQVRNDYFALLVAEKNLRLHEAFAEFTERIYELYADQATGGLIVRYEPLQLLAFSSQSRATLLASRNRYLSAWRQLTAALGLDERMPLTEVAGHADMPVPIFNHDEVLERVLKNHTDIQTARNTLQKARYDLHSAQITPIPDLDVRVTVQKDYTTPPFNIAHNLSIGMPIPIWDQNRGAIRQAQSALLRASEEEHRARNALMVRVEDAYERYVTNNAQVEYYRDKVLPNLGYVYGRALLRMTGQVQAADASVASLDIVTHQQIYAQALATYAAALAAQWQAVADLANLLQIDDLYLALESPPHAAPECDKLAPLPCNHPCSPLP